MPKTKSKYCVYLHIIPECVSGYKYRKYYVGITCRKPEIRWNNGEGYKTQPFYRAIKKYGWDNIKHKILFKKLTLEEAKTKEIEMIKFYKSKIGQFGYNVTEGGDLNKNSTRERIVYCVELKRAFKNSRIASDETKDNENSIYNKCKYFNSNKNFQENKKVKYNYVFIEDINYIEKNKKIDKNSKAIVWLQNNKVYCGFSKLNLIENEKFRREYTTIEKYYKLLKNGNLYKINRVMKIHDYFQLFDYTE